MSQKYVNYGIIRNNYVTIWNVQMQSEDFHIISKKAWKY